MRISVMLALGVTLGFPVLAAAQDTVQQPAAECLCVLPTEAGPQVAAVQDVQGQVLLSGVAGYTAIRSNTEISVGDRLVLLDDGRAVLTGPACRVALAPDSTISLVPSEAGICIAQTRTAPGAPPSLLAGQLPNSELARLLVFGGLVPAGVIGAISAATEDVPAPVSP